MRTSFTLCAAFLFLFWRLWHHLSPLRELGMMVASTWIALTLSYNLSRFVWTRLFVTKIAGDGKAVLITGCDTGFGNRLAKRLSRNGFLVFAGCLSCESVGAEELKNLHNIEVLPLDVTKQKQVDEALDLVKKLLGNRGKCVLCAELWSVVANAGIGSCGLLEWMTMEAVTNIFDVNVFGVLRVTKKFLPLLHKSSGRVVAIASPFGHFTQPMIVPYCMSKHAVVSMMDGLRRECHGSGVDFVIVEPSAYRTPIFKTGSTPMDLVMQEFRQQEPDAIAHYTHQDVEDWMKALDKSFSAIMREDPEEGVSVMERAVRETYPKAIYRSPWGLDTPCVFFMTLFPRDITDFASLLLHKIQLRMK
ncbi:hypothetical protein HPB49_015949 [Dermacentor silvarum]|uniref:Uncharacterized protein n=1 Tax=Dermacentor silvarum TaxID=543639 RepID=A0ACB8C4C6_DERSI|nr:hypothetical protein HPB49_015949 [Dermacentor silvarum]